MTNNKTAMTLIELIMASVILCVIIAGIGVVMNLSIRAYDFVTTEASKQGNVKTATEHLLKYIKNSAYCKAVNSTTLELYGTSSELLGTYNVSNDKKLIFAKPAGNPQIISENTLLTFAEEAGDPGQAREIRIDFSQPINQTTYISCRLTLPNTWAKTFGGLGADDGFSVQQTSDGGYILAGSSGSFGGWTDAYLVKTDEFGGYQWSRTFGGNGDDRAYCVQQTSDGGYILAGTTTPQKPEHNDVYLIKTDEFGKQQWSKTFGGSEADSAFSVQQTSDGGYILAGFTRSFGLATYDSYLIKIDEFGEHQWSRTFGGSDQDHAFCVQQTSDGGYILSGKTRSFGNDKAYLIKTDEFGEHQWSKTFGGGGLNLAWFVQQTSDGGYILAGRSNNRVYLLKTDELGEHQWSKAFGRGGGENSAFSVQQTSDGGYILAGQLDIYLVKTDEFGKQQWSKAVDSGSDQDRGFSVQQTSDGGYILTGTWASFGGNWGDVYLLKTDADGNCPQAEEPLHIPDIATNENIAPEHDDSVPVHDPGAPS